MTSWNQLGLKAHLLPFFQSLQGSQPSWHLARVMAVLRDRYRLENPEGTHFAHLSGSLRQKADSTSSLPAVGDWVAFRPGASPADPGLLIAILPREGVLARSGSDGVREVLACHVDLAVLVTSLNGDLNPRRLDRMVALAWEGGILSLVVLTKADLHAHPEEVVSALSCRWPGVTVLAVSSVGTPGLDLLLPHLHEGKTAVLLGTSGVGKSTLTNRLLGLEAQATAPIREDDARGRHTTTHRQAFVLPEGRGLLIDTPGIRSVALDGGEEGVALAFAEVEDLASQCRYRDCVHRDEPGCAVVAAREAGDLTEERLRSYHKLKGEQAFQARKEDVLARNAERDRWKVLHKAMRREGKGR